MEKDIPSVVETLKYFCTILLGQKLKIYTNHKTSCEISAPIYFAVDVFTTTKQ